MSAISENLAEVHAQIAAAAAKSGRAPDDVQLLAVSKSWPADIIREAAAANHCLFGESKIQEAAVKIPLLPAKLQWHFIGHLQSNKIRKAIPLFRVIHSIDSLELARQADRVAAEFGLFPEVYLQVNIDGEASKFGFSPSELRSEIDGILELERLHLLGLMLIPPFTPDPEESRPHFVALRELRDELEERGGAPLPGLSMGMSHDFDVAIEEGATIVRVGTAIFGKRKGTLASKPSL